MTPHEPARWMRIPIELLVLLCLAVGIAPGWFVDELLRVAAGSVVGPQLPHYSLALWHGFNLPLAMSIGALLLGVAIYRWRQPLGRLNRFLPADGGQRGFDGLQALLLGLARKFSMAWHRNRLQRGLLLWLACVLLAGLAPWLPHGITLAWPNPQIDAQTPLVAVGGLLLCGGALLTVLWRQQRLLAVIAAGVVGLVTALAFVLFSSPDLALTQIAVEVVATLLLLLALRHLPAPVGEPRAGMLTQGRNLLLALLGGAGISLLLYFVLTHPVETLSGYYLQHSLSLGGGANVVNVILVDFRGYDTFGEITVLGLAGLLLIKLLQDFAVKSPPSAHEPPTIMLLGLRWLLPFALLTAAYLFLRGHQQPGGGFVAGLVTVIALALPAVAGGTAGLRRIKLQPPRWMAYGLLLALLTGGGAWWFEAEFLSSAHGHLRLPLLGDIEWASAALFDLAVYLLVVGAGWAMFGALARYTEPQA